MRECYKRSILCHLCINSTMRMTALSQLLTPGRVDQIVERRSLMSSEVRYWDGKEISWSTATVPSGWAVPHHVVCGSDRVPRVITPPIIASTRPCDCPHASASDHWIWTSATCDICCLSTALSAPSSRSWLLTYSNKLLTATYIMLPQHYHYTPLGDPNFWQWIRYYCIIASDQL